MIFLASCDKDKDENVTTGPGPGQSSFTFEKDGVQIVCHTDSAYWSYDTVFSFQPIRTIGVWGWFNMEEVLVIGSYDTINSSDFSNINHLPGNIYSSLEYYTNDTADPFEYSQIFSALTVLYCDTINSKISGTFSGDLLNNYTNDTVHFRNGTFSNVPFKKIIL